MLLAYTRTYHKKRECKQYAKRMSQLFHNNDPPIPTHYLRGMLLSLVLTESSFEFNGKNYLHTHGVTIGTKTAVSVCKYLHGGD